MPKLQHPSLAPTPEQEALSRPFDSLLGNIIQGAGSVLLGGETPGALNVAQQMVFGKILDKLGSGPQAPEMQEMLQGGAVPNWYAQRQTPPQIRVPDTLALNRKGMGNNTADLNKIEKKFYPGEGYPEYHDKLPPLVPVGENPPRPEELIYHGLATDQNSNPIQAAEYATGKVPKIQERGLSAGWFSEQPHDPFGPLFIGTKPDDVWPQYPRRSKMTIDPSVELTPYAGYGSNIKKAINPETTNIDAKSIPPEKLWLIDHQGNLLGRMGLGKDEPGYVDWKNSATQHWKNQAKPLGPDEEGVGPFDETNKGFVDKFLGKNKVADTPEAPTLEPSPLSWEQAAKKFGADPSVISPQEWSKNVLAQPAGHGPSAVAWAKQHADMPFDEQGKMIPWSAKTPAKGGGVPFPQIVKDLKSEEHSIDSIAEKYGITKELVNVIWDTVKKEIPK
jgi:hypothetical protein